MSPAHAWSPWDPRVSILHLGSSVGKPWLNSILGLWVGRMGWSVEEWAGGYWWSLAWGDKASNKMMARKMGGKIFWFKTFFPPGRRNSPDNQEKDWTLNEVKESEMTPKQLQLCSFMTQAFIECQLGAKYHTQSWVRNVFPLYNLGPN